MEINIRKSVLQNLNQATHDDVRSTIDDAIARGEEVVLPGLGVIFEWLYQASDANEKQAMIDKLVTYLN